MKLHSKKDIFYLYRSLFLSLIPLIIYGIIKNGVLLSKETNDLFIILKPLIYFGINIVLGVILDLIIFKEKKINKYLVYLSILFMISSINTPIWLYILGDILLIVFIMFDKGYINKIALVSIIITAICYFLKIYDFKNIIESSGEYIFSFMDLIFFRQVGGIASSNLILVLLLLIILLFNVLYKRTIALSGIISYMAFFLIMVLIKDPSVYIKYLINATALFEIIMIASLNEYSPHTPKKEVIYGIAVGIIGAILCMYVSLYIGILISILLLTPLKIVLEKKLAIS